MGNSLTKLEINQLEVDCEIIKPTMLETLITARKLLLIKYNSTGNYTNKIKMEIIKQEVEISQIIGIINYMDKSKMLESLNIK